MAVEVEYPDVLGKTRKFVVEEGDDTNLLLGCWKSPFTVVRAHFDDENGDTQYEFWAKVPNKADRIVIGGELYRNAATVYPELAYPTRPASSPKKLVFDSDRTAIAEYFDANYSGWPLPTNINDTVGCWAYIGSTVDLEEKDFELYGYLIKNDGYGFRYEESVYDETLERDRYYLGDINYDYGQVPQPFMFIAEKSVGDGILNGKKNGIYLNPYWVGPSYYDVIPDYFNEYPILSNDEWDAFGRGKWFAAAVEWQYEVIFSQKVAEIRDWEIISNDTPEQNTYYVVIEDKKGEIVDVKTTTTFGERVGDLIGDWAERFSDEVNDGLVKDDIVLRME